MVDAMGRASKLSARVEQDGHDRRRLERVRIGINHATALFERSGAAEEQETTYMLQRFTPR